MNDRTPGEQKLPAAGLRWRLSGQPVELQRLVGIDQCTGHDGLCPTHGALVPGWWRHRQVEPEAGA